MVPLSGRSFLYSENSQPKEVPDFNPLAAKAATISLSAFGPGGPFSFDSFADKWKKQKKKPFKKDSSSKVMPLPLAHILSNIIITWNSLFQIFSPLDIVHAVLQSFRLVAFIFYG